MASDLFHGMTPFFAAQARARSTGRRLIATVVVGLAACAGGLRRAGLSPASGGCSRTAGARTDGNAGKRGGGCTRIAIGHRTAGGRLRAAG